MSNDTTTKRGTLALPPKHLRLSFYAYEATPSVNSYIVVVSLYIYIWFISITLHVFCLNLVRSNSVALHPVRVQYNPF